jgi:hypothetical protein
VAPVGSDSQAGQLDRGRRVGIYIEEGAPLPLFDPETRELPFACTTGLSPLLLVPSAPGYQRRGGRIDRDSYFDPKGGGVEG